MLNFLSDVMLFVLNNPSVWCILAAVAFMLLLRPICSSALYLVRCAWLSWKFRWAWLGMMVCIVAMCFAYCVSKPYEEKFSPGDVTVLSLLTLILGFILNITLQKFDDESIIIHGKMLEEEQRKWDEAHPKQHREHKEFNWLEWRHGITSLKKIREIPLFILNRFKYRKRVDCEKKD